MSVLLQALIDSGISSNWFYGLMLGVSSLLIYRTLNKIETMLETHEKRLQEVEKLQVQHTEQLKR